MDLSRDQQVSDALHVIAGLVQEADDYLCESALFKTMTRSKLFRSAVRPLVRRNKKPTGYQPNKASRIELRARKMAERLDPPIRDLLPARRERKARHRYHALKGIETPRKVLGTRLRSR